MLMIVALLIGLQPQPGFDWGDLDPQRPPPFEGPATLEICLTTPRAGTHPACRPVLEPEADLLPDGLFNDATETPPSRMEGWLGVYCGPDRLAGRTTDQCRADAGSLHARSRVARLAMLGSGADGRPLLAQTQVASGAGSSGFEDTFRTGVDIEAGFELYPDRALDQDTVAADGDRCRRRESEWRDEDTGESESRYSLTCSWGSGDPETQARAREALDAVMGRD